MYFLKWYFVLALDEADIALLKTYVSVRNVIFILQYAQTYLYFLRLTLNKLLGSDFSMYTRGYPPQSMPTYWSTVQPKRVDSVKI